MWRDPLGEKIDDDTLPPAIGGYTNDPDMVELMAHMGFDFVMFDQMFTSIDWQKLELLLRTAEAAGITPMVRIQTFPWTGVYDPRIAVDVSRAMGIGAKYVRVSVSGMREVEDCVRVTGDWHRKALHIHPFDSQEEWEAGIDEMERRTVLLPLAESADALKQSAEIIRMPEIRTFNYAMTDASRVLTGAQRPDWYAPPLWDSLDEAVRVGRENNCVIGANTSYAYSMDEMHKRAVRLGEHGVRIIMVQGAPFLFQIAVGQFLRDLRQEVAGTFVSGLPG